jgi:hypothetical protein
MKRENTRRKLASWALPLALILPACTGDIGTTATIGDGAGRGGGSGAPGGGGGGRGSEPGPLPTLPGAPSKLTASPTPLRRLTRQAYDHTLFDLFGLDANVGARFAVDTLGPSGYLEGGAVAGGELEAMVDAMDALARRAVAERWDALVPCKAAAGDLACAQAFIRGFGRRVYRRPLTAAEASELEALFGDARKDGADFAGAIRLTLTAMLLSPRFHYHRERTRPVAVKDGLVRLDDHELASRLSYVLWQSMPDEALLRLADEGTLSAPGELGRQAERMLADPKAARGVRAFFGAWLGLDELNAKNDASAPAEGLLPGTYAALREGTLTFVERALLAQEATTLPALLTAKHAYVNEAGARVLGLGDAVKGSELRKVALPGGPRLGLLTQPGFLAATYSSALATPIRRGRFVFERIATCQPVPAPEGEIPEIEAGRPDASLRERLSEHAHNGVCASCHRFMDPLGFAFAGFDRFGRTRDKDDYGQPLDTRGELETPGSGKLTFADARELQERLATSPDAAACFAQQLFRFATGKAIGPEDEPSAAAFAAAFRERGLDVKGLLAAIPLVPAFHVRAPGKGETLP